jgi:hypothetical protein
MPSVDTVTSFGVAKASRFGLLQHPITLTSQMATSATDRKAMGRILRVWSKLLTQRFRYQREAAFNNRGGYSLSLAVVRASSAMKGSVNGARDASLQRCATISFCRAAAANWSSQIENQFHQSTYLDLCSSRVMNRSPLQSSIALLSARRLALPIASSSSTQISASYPSKLPFGQTAYAR